MFTENDIYRLLEEHQIKYDAILYEAFYHMEDLSVLPLHYQGVIAKNLLLKDKQGKHYYLVSIRGDQRLNLKQLRIKLESKALTFASEEELKSLLQVTSGCVSPLGILNDTLHIVSLYIDSTFKHQAIGIHPNINTATIFLQTDDLVALLKSLDCFVEYI